MAATRSEIAASWLVAAWGLAQVLFGERLPVSDGLGWDGYSYGLIARDFPHSHVVDDYLAMRLLPSGLVHVALRADDGPRRPFPPSLQLAASLASLALLLALALWSALAPSSTRVPYVIPHVPIWTALATLPLAVMYLYLPQLLFDGRFIDVAWWRRRLLSWRVAAALGLYVAVRVAQAGLVVDPTPSVVLAPGHLLQVAVLYATVRPLITFVAHATWYGALPLLVIVFWPRFCATLGRLGPGLAVATALNFYVVGAASESRLLVTMLPWAAVVVAAILDRHRPPRAAVIAILLVNVVASKVWLPIGFDTHPPYFAPDGSLLNQAFYMNLGPWMSAGSWRLQTACLLVAGAALFLTLFRVRVRGGLAVTPRAGPAGR